MIRRAALLLLFGLALTACAGPPLPTPVPPFAARGFEPFNRTDTVAIALREWRLFGEKVDDDQPVRRDPPPADKPERQPGLWERVGEYWWIGQNPASPESAWTGKHTAQGQIFPASVDGDYAWSAAFISYVMRVAGAGNRFPYAPNHATYVNAAAAGASPILRAHRPQEYAPRAGDLICFGRLSARAIRFEDLPTAHSWPGHCAMVVAVQPGQLSVIGGNVDDAVTLTHVPITATGTIATPDGTLLDPRYKWFVVLQVLYDAEAESPADE